MMQARLTAQSMGTFQSHARVIISGWICPFASNDADFPKPKVNVPGNEVIKETTNVFTLAKKSNIISISNKEE